MSDIAWTELANAVASIFVVFALPLNWVVTALLWRMSLDSDIPVQRDRAIAATAISITVSVFALIFLNNDLLLSLFANDVAKALGRTATLILAVVPALYWLRIYIISRHDQ